jgi:hypothetical protein
MNTNNLHDHRDDEHFLSAHPAFDRAAYNDRVDHAARNLSVGVTAAMAKAKPRRSALYWLAPVAIAATSAVVVLLLHEQPQPTMTERRVAVVQPTPYTAPSVNTVTNDTPTETTVRAERPAQRRTLGQDEFILEPLMAEVSPTELSNMADDALLEQIASSDVTSGDLLNITSNDIDRLAKGNDNELGF